MSVSNRIISLEDLAALHDRGVHFVLCRSRDQGQKKAKSAIETGWQKRAASLVAVRKHRTAGGLLGFIPGRSNLLVIDIDKFPSDAKDAGALVDRLGVTPLAVIRTPRGCHIYFKKSADDGKIGNRAWALDGFAGDIRGDRGYVIGWQLDKLAEALDRLPENESVSVSLFPKPTKGAGLHLVEGNRNNQLNADVFKAAQRGETDFTRYGAAAIAAGLDPAEADATIKSASEAGGKKEPSEAHVTISEHGVALAFTEQYRDTMRYCPDLGSWFEWDKTRWRPDKLQRAFHYTRTLSSAASDKKTVRTAAFARGVEAFCRADPAHVVPANYWDVDIMQLGTPGGTVDLKTGRILKADPAHRITKLTAVGPGESGECPRWLQFLDESTGGDIQLVSFLQRWAGYCLSGSVQEHALVFVYGPGGTGKSVFLSVLSGVLGDYATTAGMDVLTASMYERHSCEIATLEGARIVTASETDEGRSWAESKVKALTGGDKLSARFMRQDPFEFSPRFKLMLSGNSLPNLRDCGVAMRRRFRVVPFDKAPNPPDLELSDKLRAEWGAILAWAIEGFAVWQQEGLGTAAVIEAATDDYFDESDHFAAWLESDCCLDPDAYELATDLFASWNRYLKGRREPEETATKFGRRLRATHGLHKHKVGTVRWVGVKLTGMDSYPV